MASFRRLAMELNRRLNDSSDEDNGGIQEDAEEERGARRDIGRYEALQAVGGNISRIGTREVIFLSRTEREEMFRKGRNGRRGEVPRGGQRTVIQRENRIVRVQFRREMTSREVREAMRAEFEPVDGRRRNRNICRLLRSPTTQ